MFFFFFLFGEIQTYPAFFFFFKIKLNGVKLLYSVMLVSAVQQSEPVISVHIFPHLKPPPSPNYLTPPGHHRAWSWALCALHQHPTYCFTHGSVYMLALLNSSTLPSPPWVHMFGHIPVVAIQSLSSIQLFATPWTAACQASLSLSISWSLLKLMFIKSMMPSNHLILHCPLLLLPSIFPRIRVFSNESALCIKWPKY